MRDNKHIITLLLVVALVAGLMPQQYMDAQVEAPPASEPEYIEDWVPGEEPDAVVLTPTPTPTPTPSPTPTPTPSPTPEATEEAEGLPEETDADQSSQDEADRGAGTEDGAGVPDSTIEAPYVEDWESTATPTEEATAPPTEESTVEPGPEPEMETPTATVAVEPSAEPVTPTATVAPDPTVVAPTQVATEPMGTPTVPAARGRMSTQSTVQPQQEVISDRSGSLTGCRVSSTIITPGGSVIAECNLTISAGFLDNVNGRVTRPALSNNYQASIGLAHNGKTASLAPGSGEGSASLQMGTAGFGGSRTAAVTIRITAPLTARTDSTFTATFTSCRVGNISGNCYFLDPHHGSVTITLKVGELGLVEGTHYTAGCMIPPGTSSSAGFGDTVVIHCSVTALTTIGSNRFLRLNDLATTLNGTGGWSGKLLTMDGEEVGTVPGVYHRVPPADLPPETTFDWQIHMTPTGCAAQSGQLRLGVMGNITLVENNVPGTTYTSAEKIVTMNFLPPPPGSVDAAVLLAPDLVQVPYSLDDQEAGSTSVTLLYTASGCEPWSGYLEITPFEGGEGNDSRIVPELKSASHGNVEVSGPGLTTLDFPELKTIDTNPTLIVSGSGPGMERVVKHTINLEYTIPAGTPPGTYEATIIVTTTPPQVP